jgi:hypothetical protein
MAGPPSSRSPFPSSPGEPSLRRLGVGGGSGGDRPLRAQIVVALVAALALVAVPMYLMRGPSAHKTAPAASASGSAAPPLSAAPLPSAAPQKPPERLKLGAPQRVRCGNTRGNQLEGNACDQLTVFEEALAKTIRENEGCWPKVKEQGSINFVLTIDFVERRLHVFPGASGDFRGPQARRATECVKRALPKPNWPSIQHQFRRYTIAILATFLPESALRDPTGTPSFE